MRSETVEILSDRVNAAVMRHPDRAFPGVLVQGDNLHGLCRLADLACQEVGRGGAGFRELNALRNALWSYLSHYKVVLLEHGSALPFSEDRAF